MLVRIYGIYKVRVHTKKEPVFFAVQDNLLLWPKLPIHLRFDLKGSTRNRRAKDTDAVLKDLNWQGALSLENAVSKSVRQRHERDCAFLAQQKVLDYSVMVGIHRPTPQEDGAPTTTLPATQTAPSQSTGTKGWGKLRQMMAAHSLTMRSECGFYGPYNGQNAAVYLMGIIDYLIPWDRKKRAEHCYKQCCCKAEGTSCVPPAAYADRQVAFIQSLLDASDISGGLPASLRTAGKQADQDTSGVVPPVVQRMPLPGEPSSEQQDASGA